MTLDETTLPGPSDADRLPSGDVPQQHREDDADEPGIRFTIDELAAETGVPSRTIRFYQAKGALPPPGREGRVAFYDQQHVERLELIAELQDRGLHLKAIRDLLGRADAGDVSVGDWLGLGDKLRAPWSDDQPRLVPEDELEDLVGDRSKGFVASLVRADLLHREGGSPPSYLVRSPGLLGVVLKLHDAGFDLDEAVRLTDGLRRRLSKAADDVADAFVALAARDRASTAAELGDSIDALRSVGLETVRLVFAQEMERSLRVLVERGKVLPRMAKQASRRRRRTQAKRSD